MVEFKDVREMAQSFVYLAIFMAVALFVVGYSSAELTALSKTQNINVSPSVVEAINGIAQSVGTVGGTMITVVGVVIIIIVLLKIVAVLRERFQK